MHVLVNGTLDVVFRSVGRMTDNNIKLMTIRLTSQTPQWSLAPEPLIVSLPIVQPQRREGMSEWQQCLSADSVLWRAGQSGFGYLGLTLNTRTLPTFMHAGEYDDFCSKLLDILD